MSDLFVKRVRGHAKIIGEGSPIPIDEMKKDGTWPRWTQAAAQALAEVARDEPAIPPLDIPDHPVLGVKFKIKRLAHFWL